jgi:two-component sensor histidine kinase
MRDITASKQTAAKILESLQEKEALLREIHHRVKNNLQVITSILNLQSGYITDPMALEVFRECQGRIRTMSLIHEQLYRSQGLARIDFKDYLESLVSLLLRSQTRLGLDVRTELKIQRIILDADTAIPLGLIANELVSNCLKHAFIGRTAGRVTISLDKQDGRGYELQVADDGHGLMPGFNPEQSPSLGVRLVKILCGQIDGRLVFTNNPGAQFSVLFPERETPPNTADKIIFEPSMVCHPAETVISARPNQWSGTTRLDNQKNTLCL